VTNKPEPEQDTCGAVGSLNGPLPGHTGRCYRRPHHDPRHRDQSGREWDDGPAWTAEQHAGHGSPCEKRSDGSCARPASHPRTTPDNPATSADGADNPLRVRYEAVIDEGFRTFDADETDGYLIDHITDAVLACRNAELAALRIWLATEAAHCRRNADAASVEEARQALDGMAAGCELAARVIDGMAAGRGLPVSGGALKRAHVALAEQAGKDQAAVARARTLGDIWLSEGADAATREAGRRILAALDGSEATPDPVTPHSICQSHAPAGHHTRPGPAPAVAVPCCLCGKWHRSGVTAAGEGAWVCGGDGDAHREG
jgi:hypothetical protein